MQGARLVALSVACYGLMALEVYLVFWAIFQAYKLATGKEGMGYGDFKLLAALGAWLGVKYLLAIVLLSSIVGAVIGILLLVIGKLANKDIPMPFGPYLAGAGLLALALSPAAVPALLMLTGSLPSAGWLVAWFAVISAMGVFAAIPIKRQLINIEALPFPTGTATADDRVRNALVAAGLVARRVAVRVVVSRVRAWPSAAARRSPGGPYRPYPRGAMEVRPATGPSCGRRTTTSRPARPGPAGSSSAALRHRGRTRYAGRIHRSCRCGAGGPGAPLRSHAGPVGTTTAGVGRPTRRARPFRTTGSRSWSAAAGPSRRR